LFAGLDDAALERVASIATEFDAVEGQVLAERGQPGSGMFVIEEGGVTVELTDGRRIDLGPGEFFGEVSLLVDQPRSARVRSHAGARCLAISRSDFGDLLEDEPAIAVAMLPVLARRLTDPH
jgi:CRP-like cAMP-binding protein